MNLTPLHRERLAILRDFLRNLKLAPDQKFNMGTWGRHSIDELPTELMCGTTACAAGWATTIPEFKAAGLKLRWESRVWKHGQHEGGNYEAVVEVDGMPDDSHDYSMTSYKALRYFFGTDEPFDPDNYESASYDDDDEIVVQPSHVADYIDGILAADEVSE